MPTCMSLVSGIVAAAPTGEPSAATSWTCTPRCPAALEYQARTVRLLVVGCEVGVVAIGAERSLEVVVGCGGREAGVHPRAERPGEALEGRAVGAHGRGGVARVRLRAERDDGAGLERPACAPVRRERGVGLVLRVVAVRRAEAAPERPQAAGLDDERGVREAGPPALHRGRGADLARRRDHGVEEVGGVRPGGVVPGDVEDAVRGARQADLVGARPIRRGHPFPGGGLRRRSRRGGNDHGNGNDARLHGASPPRLEGLVSRPVLAAAGDLSVAERVEEGVSQVCLDAAQLGSSADPHDPDDLVLSGFIELDRLQGEVVERVPPVLDVGAQSILAPDRARVIGRTLGRPVVDVVGPELEPCIEVAAVEGRGRVADGLDVLLRHRPPSISFSGSRARRSGPSGCLIARTIARSRVAL